MKLVMISSYDCNQNIKKDIKIVIKQTNELQFY